MMESQHMTQQTFAQFIEMSPASLSSIFNGRTKPTLNTVEAIRNKIPSISLDWLLYGKGPMFLDEVSAGAPSSMNSGDLVLDFGMDMDAPAANPSANASDARPSQQRFPSSYPPADLSSASGSHRAAAAPEIKIVERAPRQVTEIRVFFDDQTYESFVPKK